MNMMGFLGCLIVAIDCASRATGSEPQKLFASDMVSLWWLPAILWGGYAIAFAIRGLGSLYHEKD